MKWLSRLKEKFSKRREEQEHDEVAWMIQEVGTGFIDGVFVDEKTPDLLTAQRGLKQYWDSIRPEHSHTIITGITEQAWRNMRPVQLHSVVKTSWVHDAMPRKWRSVRDLAREFGSSR